MVNDAFGHVKFSNLDFDSCKVNPSNLPVKFKLIGFSPSFDMSAKNHYVA
jgi:hypothetical protein